MTIPDFLSRVHLPTVYRYLGSTKGIVFKKVPGFGWCAWNPQTQEVQTIFDLFEQGQKSRADLAYRYVTLDHPDVQEVPMHFADPVANRLIGEYRKWVYMRALYSGAREQVVQNNVFKPAGSSDRVKFNKIADRFNLNGLANHALLGCVNDLIVSQPWWASNKKDVNDEKLMQRVHGQVIIPYFVAPKILGGFEFIRLSSGLHRDPAYAMTQSGWYGLTNIKIHDSVAQLGEEPGCTWDEKVPFWTDELVPLNEKLKPETCVDIWLSRVPILTKPSAIELLAKSQFEVKDINRLSRLSHAQVVELEDATGKQWCEAWTRRRETQVTVDTVEFYQKNNRYYYRKGRDQIEYTNFIVKLGDIVQKDNDFFQQGHLYFNDQERPFEVPCDVFRNYSKLNKALFKLFLEAGLGVPIVSSTYNHYLVNVIRAFNPDTPIKTAQPIQAGD